MRLQQGLQATAIIKDCYKIIMYLTTNGTVIDDVYSLVVGMTEKLKLESESESKESEEPDYGEEEELEEKQEKDSGELEKEEKNY